MLKTNFKLVYTIDGEVDEFLETPRQFNAILFLSSLLPYPEFNSIANFSAMKVRLEEGDEDMVKRFWYDGENRHHVITMELVEGSETLV